MTREHKPGDRDLSVPQQEASEAQAPPSALAGVDAQREQAAQQISRTMRAWRKAKGEAKPANIPQGGGAPLGGDVRKAMEPRLGADLGDVRVHTSGESAEAATNLGARAFTVGSDVHFGAGQFTPGTREGDQLIAHELTHVVQGQRSGIQRKAANPDEAHEHEHGDGPDVSHPHDAAEVEADAVSAHVANDMHGADHGADHGHGGAHEAGHVEQQGGGGEGGAVGAGGGVTARPAAKISAKLSSVGLKVFRAGTLQMPKTLNKTVKMGAYGGGGQGGYAANSGYGGFAGKGPPPPAPPQPGQQQPVDPVQDFRNKLGLWHPLTRQAFDKLLPADKAKVSAEECLKGLELDPMLGLVMMNFSQRTFDGDPRFGLAIIRSKAPNAFIAPLKTAGLFDNFVNGHPRRQELSNADGQALWPFLVLKPRAVFNKVFPDLKDGSYNAAMLVTTAWQDEHIQKLYFSLLRFAPVAHVQTSSGGFFLGTYFDFTQKGKWEQLGFAWQDGNKMVLPWGSTADKAGGGATHDMTGGQDAHKGEKKKQKEAAKQGGPQTTHFDGSVLHEVGHAVANHVGGNDWSKARNQFAVVDIDTWSKALFDDSAVLSKSQGGAIGRLFGGKKRAAAKAVTPAEARLFLARSLVNDDFALKALQTASEPEMREYVSKYCTGQPLYAYAQKRKADGDDYKLPPSNIKGGLAYAYLNRFANSYCTYKAEAYTNRVSWYSISSPMEWFAEQYAHYYRMGKTGVGLDADVKQYMEKLDQANFDPSKAGPDGDGQLSVSAGGSQAGAANQAGKQEGAQTAAGQGQIPNTIHRIPFAW